MLFIPALWFLRRRIRALLAILAVAAAIAAPWYALVAARNGAPFYNEFFGHQQFARFFSGEILHIQPFWFYLPVLAAGLFPWTPLALLLFSKKLYQDRRTTFLAAWFVLARFFLRVPRKTPWLFIAIVSASDCAPGNRNRPGAPTKRVLHLSSGFKRRAAVCAT